MADSRIGRTRAFISYSHADRQYLEHLQKHLKPLLRESRLQVWDDTLIQPGSHWREEIEQALASARVAILLVSGSFLASDFIAGEELPKLLEAAQKEGARILPLILSHSVFSRTKLGQFQAFNDPARPLNTLPDYEQEAVLARFAETIYEALSAPYPIGTRLLTYTGHTSFVSGVAWSPDGKCIASGGYDKTVQICDVASGQHLITYTGQNGVIHTVAWSPDSRRLASGSGAELVGGDETTVHVWDVATRQRIVNYMGHTSSVRSVAWSSDGRRLASGGFDNIIQVWNTASGQRLAIYIGHTDVVEALAWSPDGRRLASGSWDHTVQIWDTANGQRLFTYSGHANIVQALAWSPDGRRLASGGRRACMASRREGNAMGEVVASCPRMPGCLVMSRSLPPTRWCSRAYGIESLRVVMLW